MRQVPGALALARRAGSRRWAGWWRRACGAAGTRPRRAGRAARRRRGPSGGARRGRGPGHRPRADAGSSRRGRPAPRAPPPRCEPRDGRRCRRSPRRSRCGSPVWIPMRTRIGPPPSASRAAAAAATASAARAKAMKKASPWVSTSTPSCLVNAPLSAVRCSARRSAYPAPCSWRSRVEPSTSVKRKVTVPVGSSGLAMPAIIAYTAAALLSPSSASVSASAGL